MAWRLGLHCCHRVNLNQLEYTGDYNVDISLHLPVDDAADLAYYGRNLLRHLQSPPQLEQIDCGCLGAGD